MISNLPDTSRIKKIVFWQRALSSHQDAYISELANVSGLEVILVVKSEQGNERKDIGCNPPDYGEARIIFNPDVEMVNEIIEIEHYDAVHIFSFLSKDKFIKKIFRLCLNANSKIGILSEGRDSRGLKGKFRIIHGFFNERMYRKNIDFVLAIGHLAKSWYLFNGYPEEKLYDFCYTINEINLNKSRSSSVNDKVKITYVGRVDKGKQLDLLISALKDLLKYEWCLDIIGDGPELMNNKLLVKEYGLEGRTKFYGVLNNSNVHEKLKTTDFLVLPSFWDGWGAVVNEALMNGVPVVCSDYCGAADLIFNNRKFGDVFNYKSSGELKEILKRRIKEGPISRQLRQQIINYSKSFSGNVLALYLLDILNHCCNEKSKKINAPWVTYDN